MSYEKRKEINIRFVLPLHWIKTFYVQLNIKTDLFVTEFKTKDSNLTKTKILFESNKIFAVIIIKCSLQYMNYCKGQCNASFKKKIKHDIIKLSCISFIKIQCV